MTMMTNIIINLYSLWKFVYFFLLPTGSTQRIPAHKYVLAVGSSVFYAMFYGGLKSEDEIQVPDVEPSAFLTLLR